MAIGRHWEWRAFGTLSQRFARTFANLQLVYGFAWADVVDDYLWIHGSRVNVKLRTGIEDGLKFKRIERENEDIELWTENPEDLYPYQDLNDEAFAKLAADLSITLPAIPPGVFDRGRALALLQKAVPPVKVVRVEKRRQTRKFGNSGNAVKVEVAQISAPQYVCSVGVENDKDLGNTSSEEQIVAARAAILSALRELKLDGEKSLSSMSYLKALGTWASGSSV